MRSGARACNGEGNGYDACVVEVAPSIQTFNGQFLAAERGGGNVVNANRGRYSRMASLGDALIEPTCCFRPLVP